MTPWKTNTENVFGKSVQESGTYNVKITDDSEFKMTSTNKEMAVLNYEVLDGKYQGGAIRYDNLVWDESSQDALDLSMKRFDTIFKAVGVPSGTDINGMGIIVQSLKGKQLNITVDWEFSDYSGKYNLGVKSYTTVDSNGSIPSGVKRPDTNNQTKNDPIANSSQPIDISDDDLPF